MPIATGQILKDRYRIVRLLGQGGFGAVYRAWDTVLERPCAVKENLDPSPAAERQFQREARLLARLKHPNLPDVKDYFILPGQGQYLVMDFVEGDDLEELLARSGGKLPEEQAIGWIEQICRALDYLHSQNPPVIHRDIKPANIKITPQGQALLVDFGIAKVSDPALGTLSGARAATPGYAPFEQYGQEPTDARSDIYSLGATLYTLLTGQPPLESIARVGGRTLTNPSQLNPSITPHTEATILKALALHPEGRYQSAAEFRQSLTPSLSLPGRGAGVRDDGVRVSSTVQVIQPGDEQSQLLTELLPPHPELQKSRPSWLLPAGVGLAALVCLAGLVWIIASLVQPPPGTPPPLTRLETTSAAAVVGTDMPVGITIPPSAPTTQAFFTPTARLSPATAVPEQRVDEKGLAMSLVPAGQFQMGSDADEGLAECQKFRVDCQKDWFLDEEPVHSVYLDAFYIDVYEVTNVAFQQCVQAGECSTPHATTYYQDPDYARHPVVYVDWSQARTYCQWRGGDLPTEAQWEKAARGGLQGKVYPWGDEAPVCEEGAENGAQFSACDGQTVEVGDFSPNGYGLYDMAGSVWEWVLDWYLDTFYAGLPPENTSWPGSGESRVLRGGSWSSYELALRVASRGSSVPVGGHDGFGFRCAFSP